MGETKTLMTAEQLLEIAGSRRLELVRGELVEMSPVGMKHSRLVIRLGSWIDAYVSKRKLGVVGTELGFILARRPDLVRAPDVSFISADRLGAANPEGFFEGAPDLAVEVLSPEDRASDLQEKIREYLAAGAKLVWLVDPRSDIVTVYHPPADAHIHSGNEEVAGGSVLPGFSFRPADLFRLD